jgi:hypothetical protein
MNIIKSGTPSTAKGRTGLKAGDILTVYFPKPSSKNELLLSVRRQNSNNVLRFEGTTNDDKALVPAWSSTESGARMLIMFICQITGLQAKLLNSQEGHAVYELQKGKGLFES